MSQALKSFEVKGEENTNNMIYFEARTIGLPIFAHVLQSLPGTVPRKTSNNDIIYTGDITGLYHLHRVVSDLELWV